MRVCNSWNGDEYEAVMLKFVVGERGWMFGKRGRTL